MRYVFPCDNLYAFLSHAFRRGISQKVINIALRLMDP